MQRIQNVEHMLAWLLAPLMIVPFQHEIGDRAGNVHQTDDAADPQLCLMLFQQVIHRNEQNHAQTELCFHQHAPEHRRQNDQQLYALPGSKEPQSV